jgi:beta-phosphoglucomutase
MESSIGGLSGKSDFTAIIFDFDGVIVDSEPLHAEAKRRVLHDFGIDFDEIILADFKGRTDKAFFEYVAAGLARGKASIFDMQSQKNSIYRELFMNVPLVGGAYDFLLKAKGRLMKLGLVTSATRQDFELANSKYHLSDFFAAIVTGDDCTFHKPHPMPYLLGLRKLDASPQSVLVIEDAPNGIAAAKSADLRVAAIKTSFTEVELSKAGADFIFATYGEISHYLNFGPHAGTS